MVIFAAGILFLGSIYAYRFAVPGNVAGAVAFAAVFAAAFAAVFAGSFAGSFAGAVAVTFAGTVAFAVASAVAGALAILGAGAVAVSVAGAVTTAEERSSRPMAWRLLFCGGLVALLIVAIKMPDDFGAGQPNRAVFGTLTFCLLPLVNAVFDFASVGLTRYLLRVGLEQKRAARRADCLSHGFDVHTGTSQHRR